MKRISIALVIAAATLAFACEEKKEAPKPADSAKKPVASASVSASASAKPVEKGTPITKPQLKAGLKFELAMKRDVDSTTTEDDGKAKKDTAKKVAYEGKKVVEVLAVAGDVPSKLKVSFADSKLTEDGKEGKKCPLATKTFQVEEKDGKLLVKDEKGEKDASKDEVEAATKALRGAFKPMWFVEGLPGEVKVGDKVKSLSDAFKKHLENAGKKAEEKKDDKAAKPEPKKEAAPAKPAGSASAAASASAKPAAAPAPAGNKVTVQDAVVKEIKDGVVTFELAATVEGEKEIGKEKLGVTFKKDIKVVLKVKTDGSPVALEKTVTVDLKSKDDPKAKKKVTKKVTKKESFTWGPAPKGDAAPAASASASASASAKPAAAPSASAKK